MTRISVYDDTAQVIDAICNEYDWSEAELMDILLEEAASVNEDIAKVFDRLNS